MMTAGGVIYLEPRYYGSVEYYARVAAAEAAVVNYNLLFDKRMKEAHRCTIADKEGRARLTAPIGKPHGITRATWGDILLSDHNHWWQTHRVTLESAYGRTPFFEYYIDRFLPFLTDGVTELYPTLRSLNQAIDGQVREILLLPPQQELPLPSPSAPMPEDHAEELSSPLPPYWQVRDSKLGFIAGLSVLDLIFNLGPEAALYIRRK